MIRWLLWMGFNLCCIQQSVAQIEISGAVSIDSQWAPIIYASELHGLHEMYVSSHSLIVGQAPIIDGAFQMTVPLSSKKMTLVRLHISQKNQPEATMIIGGDQENHGFFAVQDGAKIQINRANDRLFSHFNARDPINVQLHTIETIVHEFEMRYAREKRASNKVEILKDLAATLIHYADTTNQILAAIYATYNADIGTNQADLALQYSKIGTRLGRHPYLPISAYPATRKIPYMGLLVSALILLLLAGILRLIPLLLAYRKKKRLDRLSQQEERVMELLLAGHSNKSAASELHIEVSTIKSHVHNIFTKLKVKSRKDLKKYGMLFRNA